MRVAILRRPKGVLAGMRVDQMQVCRSYDVPTRLARALIREGFARLERRSQHRRRQDRDKQKQVCLLSSGGDFVDVLERILTKGVVFEVEGDVEEQEPQGG